jgi:hypothetical protein
MAGTRRPDEAEIRDALIVGVVLGFAIGVIVGAWLA